MEKYTPGSWKVYSEVNVRGENGDYVCSCGFNDNTRDALGIAQANARLIASAPELLEALKSAIIELRELGAFPDVIERYEQAIAKAEGD